MSSNGVGYHDTDDIADPVLRNALAVCRGRQEARQLEHAREGERKQSGGDRDSRYEDRCVAQVREIRVEA